MNFNCKLFSYIRKAYCYTKQSLADSSGIGFGTLKDIESGKHEPLFSTITKIADILYLPLDIISGRNLDNYIVINKGDSFTIIYRDEKHNDELARLILYLQSLSDHIK